MGEKEGKEEDTHGDTHNLLFKSHDRLEGNQGLEGGSVRTKPSQGYFFTSIPTNQATRSLGHGSLGHGTHHNSLFT